LKEVHAILEYHPTAGIIIKESDETIKQILEYKN
jgi:hypothetical protein